jgi:PTS system nitrogen regulatory IIA component
MIPHLNQSEAATSSNSELIVFPTLKPELIKTDMWAKSKKQALNELSTILADACPGMVRKEVFVRLKVREQLATTGVGRGVALPHAQFGTLTSMCSAFGISRRGVPFDAVDDQLVHFFLALVTPSELLAEPLRVLACASRLFKDPAVQHRLLQSGSSVELFEALYEVESTYPGLHCD